MKFQCLLMAAGALLPAWQLAHAQSGFPPGFGPGTPPPSGIGNVIPDTPGRTPTPAPAQDPSAAVPYLPIGATANGAAGESGYAWFIDPVTSRVLVCVKSPALPIACEAVKIPAATP